MHLCTNLSFQRVYSFLQILDLLNLNDFLFFVFAANELVNLFLIRLVPLLAKLQFQIELLDNFLIFGELPEQALDYLTLINNFDLLLEHHFIRSLLLQHHVFDPLLQLLVLVPYNLLEIKIEFLEFGRVVYLALIQLVLFRSDLVLQEFD